MSKTNEKMDPSITGKLEQEIIKLRGLVRDAEQLLEIKDNPSWLQIQDGLRQKLDMIERQLDNFEKLSEREILLHLKERVDWRIILTMMEQTNEALPEMRSILDSKEREYAERKEKIGTAG